MADMNQALMQTLHNLVAKITPTPSPAKAPANDGKNTQNTPTSATPGNIPASAAENLNSVSTEGTAANGTIPNNSVTTTKSPLDDFATLWQTDSTKVDPLSENIFNVDMAKLQEAAKKTDFIVNNVNPELLGKIAKGGDEAVQALVTVMQGIAQQNYAQSAFASTQIAERAAKQVSEKIIAALPQHIKQLSVSDSLRNENPALKHPAIAPIIELLQHSITQKHPNASTTEAKEMAMNYVKGLVETLTVKKPTDTKKSNEVDWSTFLE